MLISILLALALNIDALAIGVSYGIRNIRIPFGSLLLMALTSVGYTLAAGGIGAALSRVFPAWIGSVLLIGIGGYTIISAFKDPPSFDFDASKTIDLREAFALSLALSLDATGVSLSFALSDGLVFFLPIAIGLCHFCFLAIGKRIGAHIPFRTERNARALNLISGMILTLLGILRFVL